MSENENKVFRTVRKTVRQDASHNPETEFYGINLITSATHNAPGAARLHSPLDAERRRAKLFAGTHEGDSSVRKMRKPTRHLSLKPAPKIPTAPKDPREIRKRFLLSQLKTHYQRFDKSLFLLLLLLAGIGILAVNSATLTYQSSRYVIIQSLVAVVGTLLAVLMSFFDYRAFAKKYRVVLLINIALLVFTFIFGEGVTDKTNANWINLGFIKIQPSEFSKILFIYSFAVHLCYVRDRINKIFTALLLFAHAALIIGLTLLQKDLGTVTIFLAIFVVMCFAGHLNIWYFIAGGAAAAALSPFIFSKLNYFQQQRILALFDPAVDPNATGVRHQTVRGMTAIRLGGITGSGYAHGDVTQSDFFAKHTDMIFSTICEETGLLGGIALIVLYIVFLYKIIKTAYTCDNPLGGLICAGVAAMFMIQLAENIGMCLGVMPVIGITLPFISYGGSSALSAYLAVGLVFSVATHKEKTFFT